MFNNDSNPVEVSKKKAFFEINYYGLCQKYFVKIYGDKEKYNSADVVDYLTTY